MLFLISIFAHLNVLRKFGHGLVGKSRYLLFFFYVYFYSLNCTMESGHDLMGESRYLLILLLYFYPLNCTMESRSWLIGQKYILINLFSFLSNFNCTKTQNYVQSRIAALFREAFPRYSNVKRELSETGQNFW